MTQRDPQADDRFLDLSLEEELGGLRPPDLSRRVAAADAGDRARAAAAVDAAAVDGAEIALARPRTGRGLVLAAVVLVALGGVGSWVWLSSGDEESVAAPRSATADGPLTAQELIDEFHRVMPSQPSRLRDPGRRLRFADQALGAIRAIVDFRREHPDDPLLGRHGFEFQVYGVVLGDTAMRDELAGRARRGDRDASALLLAADIIRAGDDRARANAVADLAEVLGEDLEVAGNVVQCLISAADLTEAEALALAEATDEPFLVGRLAAAAELAATSPRRLVGRPLALTGRLLGGGEFRAESLRGKVVVVNFWATWCEPSLRALPEVQAVAQKSAADVAVVGVSCDHSAAALEAYLQDHPEIGWPQLFDRSRVGWHELAYLCGVRSIPAVFVLDREGVVRVVDGLGDLEEQVAEVLGR